MTWKWSNISSISRNIKSKNYFIITTAWSKTKRFKACIIINNFYCSVCITCSSIAFFWTEGCYRNCIFICPDNCSLRITFCKGRTTRQKNKNPVFFKKRKARNRKDSLFLIMLVIKRNLFIFCIVNCIIFRRNWSLCRWRRKCSNLRGYNRSGAWRALRWIFQRARWRLLRLRPCSAGA